MARPKKSSSKNRSPKTPQLTANSAPKYQQESAVHPQTRSLQELKSRFFSPVRLAIAALLVVLAVYLVLNPSLLVVATVNNRPIWRWEFEKRVVSRFGSELTDELVNETLISDEASRRGVKVADTEVEARIKDIEKNLGGGSLTEALKAQGMTLADLKSQIRLQLMAEKLIADKVQVSDEEVAAFIEQNRAFLTATDEASLALEARNNLRQEKLGTEFRKLFDDLKNKAQIRRFF